MFKPLGFTLGKIATLDQEIAKIEALVEDKKVDYMINVIVEKIGEPYRKVHVMTLGTPLDQAESILEIALKMVKETKSKQN